MIEQDGDPIASRIFKGNETRERYVCRGIDPRVSACRRDVCTRIPTSVTMPSLSLSLSRAYSFRFFFRLQELPSSRLFFVSPLFRSLVTSDRFHALPAFLAFLDYRRTTCTRCGRVLGKEDDKNRIGRRTPFC